MHAPKRSTAGLAVLCVFGCQRGLSPSPVTVRTIERPDQLLSGPSAFGTIGDLRMENGLILAVIAAADRGMGFAVSGGNLIDLTSLPNGEDHLNQVFLYLDDEFPRQASYRTLKVIAPGSRQEPAIVRAKGVDTTDPRIEIETDYRLEPGASWLTLISRFTSSATYTISGFEIGDAVQWGRAEHFAPGPGFGIASTSGLELPWIAGLGQGTSYAVVPDGNKMFVGPHGSTWSDPIGAKVELRPKETVSYVRHLVVGDGDTASLASAIARLRGDRTARITGSVTHQGQPVTDAEVHALDEKGGLFGVARVDRNGRYALELTPGAYQAVALAAGRDRAQPAGPSGPIRLQAGDKISVNFHLGEKTAITWRIVGEDGKGPPIKLVVIGLHGTADPDFGPVFRASGAGPQVLSARGVGEISVGPGKYRVLISRGPEFELIDQKVEVGFGARVELKGTLVRSVETPGFISADLHQHAAPSFDSGVSLPDRILANAAEGVEVLVATDHNVLTDYRPEIVALGLEPQLVSVIGTEATTHSVGHFNALPLLIRSGHPRGGMEDPEGSTPQQIVDLLRTLAHPSIAPFIQANHPRANRIGYFDLMRLDPATGVAEDPRFLSVLPGLEVVSFGFEEETEAALKDWFALLRRGMRITQTGGSDSHTIFGREIGWPRTMVCLEDDSPSRFDLAKFVAALHRGCATVSAGPFVNIKAKTARMGDVITEKSGKLEIEVEVRAPYWIPTDRLRLFVDGQVQKEIPLKNPGVRRLDTRILVTCTADCFVVAMVDSIQELTPMLTTWRDRRPRPLALTNPIYIDVDGDGKHRGTAP